MYDYTRILNVLKAQAWERAKAELYSVLQCYHPEYELGTGKVIPNGFTEVNQLVKGFIKEFEDNYV